MSSLEEAQQKNEEYLFYIYSDTILPIHKTNDIEPYIKLSEYISVFVNDIKEDNKIIFPSFVTEEYAKYFITFVESFKMCEKYKILQVNNSFIINKPVSSDTELWKDLGHELYSFTRDIITKKKFISMMNTAKCLICSVLFESLCAKVALDIKYLTKTEIEHYFQDVI